MKKNQSQLLLRILATIFAIQFTSAVDFLFNGFDSSDVSLYGNATIESRILTLTKDSEFEIGRALYPSRIPTKQPNTSLVLPFSTSFIFAMAPYAGKLGGHGFVFLFAPHVGIQGSSSAQHLGLFNLTNNGDPNNNIFGVEFDVFRNQEFGDISGNHVGIDVNSLTSVSDHQAGYWPDDDSELRDERLFKNLVLNNGETYQVWIDYADSIMNVTMAPVGMKRPKYPLLSVSHNLSEVLEDEMYVGFTASTGALIQSHKILAWSFSNTNFLLSERLITEGLPSFEFPDQTPTIHRKDNKVVIIVSVVASLIAASICLFLTWWMCKRKGKTMTSKAEKRRSDSSEIFLRSDIDEVPLYSFDILANATNDFNVENKLGMGGFGPVYRGKLANGQEIAVKRLSAASGQGVEEFMNEVAVISKLQHRNLVKLLGCCVEREEKMLVYEYLQNRSLDVSLFDKSQNVLDWGKRFNIIEGIARGLLYLHRDSRLRIIHRDLKPSNILLDEYWNPKISDFGMARIFGGNQDQANTKRVMGTYGYMSPEYAMGGTFSEKSDVFSFGVLVLEIISGRRNTSFYNDELSLGLLGYAWKILNEDMNPMDLIDDRISTPAFLAGIKRCMWIGLLCVQEFPQSRPTMSTVLSMLSSEIVDLPMPEHPGFTHRFVMKRML